MTSNHGIKNSFLSNQLNQEIELSADSSHICFDSPFKNNEWKKDGLNCRSYIIGRAYDEPHGNCTIENVLLGRNYIID